MKQIMRVLIYLLNVILQYLPEDRVLKGSMKDNFWEMGETGYNL